MSDEYKQPRLLGTVNAREFCGHAPETLMMTTETINDTTTTRIAQKVYGDRTSWNHVWNAGDYTKIAHPDGGTLYRIADWTGLPIYIVSPRLPPNAHPDDTECVMRCLDQLTDLLRAAKKCGKDDKPHIVNRAIQELERLRKQPIDQAASREMTIPSAFNENVFRIGIGPIELKMQTGWCKRDGSQIHADDFHQILCAIAKRYGFPEPVAQRELGSLAAKHEKLRDSIFDALNKD
jgi:HAMP domain-containing protein